MKENGMKDDEERIGQIGKEEGGGDSCYLLCAISRPRTVLDR